MHPAQIDAAGPAQEVNQTGLAGWKRDGTTLEGAELCAIGVSGVHFTIGTPHPFYITPIAQAEPTNTQAALALAVSMYHRPMASALPVRPGGVTCFQCFQSCSTTESLMLPSCSTAPMLPCCSTTESPRHGIPGHRQRTGRRNRHREPGGSLDVRDLSRCARLADFPSLTQAFQSCLRFLLCARGISFTARSKRPI